MGINARTEERRFNRRRVACREALHSADHFGFGERVGDVELTVKLHVRWYRTKKLAGVGEPNSREHFVALFRGIRYVTHR
jgi:hypothetical protein